LKVLLYAHLPSSSGAGGVQTYLAALIKALGALPDGDEEYLILGPPPAEAEWLRAVLGPNQRLLTLEIPRQAPGPRALGAAGRGLRAILRPGLHSARWRRPLLRLLRGTAATAGIPVSPGYYESFGAPVIHFPYQRFVRTRLASVFNPHDLQHLHLPELCPPAAYVERELQYYHGCRHATRIAVATPWVAADITAQYGIPAARIVAVPWGAATAAQPAPSRERQEAVRQHYAAGRAFLFYPAVAWSHKNHPRLLEAMARLRARGETIQLVLSGGAPRLTEGLAEACRRLGVEGQVTIAGHLPDADLRPLYAAARAVVVPTLFEAASGPVAEAWLEGTPAACSDIPQLRAQADGAALFFDPRSVDAMADSMQRILHDEPLRARLAAEGSARIATQSWEQTARRYRALYREAAADQP
jgi:glycosyltransferase involved in cell wall biosynthesis